jgi:hypothetical protein
VYQDGRGVSAPQSADLGSAAVIGPCATAINVHEQPQYSEYAH